MPAQITHILIANKALENIFGSSEMPSWLEKTNHLFNVGCQGPDLFYHNQITRPLAIEYGSLLHRRDYGVFCSKTLKWIKEERVSNPNLLSYLAGFITHAIVDRVFHPFIMYVSFFSNHVNSPIPAGKFHAFYERILDVLLLKFFTAKTPMEFDTSKLLTISDSVVETIIDLYSKLLLQVYPERLNTDKFMLQRLKNTWTDSIWFYRVTNPKYSSIFVSPSHVKELCAQKNFVIDKPDWTLVSLLFPESLTENVDWYNEAHKEWKNPSLGTVQTESIKDLAFIAIEKVTKVLKQFFFLVDSPYSEKEFALFEKLIENTSLCLVDEEGKPGLPKFSDSSFFPLDFEFQRQIDIRLDWWFNFVNVDDK